MLSRTVHAHQFSFGDRRHCFDVYVPPHEHGHSIRIIMDPQAQVGTLTIMRYEPDTPLSNANGSRGTARRVETLAEHLQSFQPLGSQTRADTSADRHATAPTYQSSHNTFPRDIPPSSLAHESAYQDVDDSDDEYTQAPPSSPAPAPATPRHVRGITVYPPGSPRVQFAPTPTIPSSRPTGIQSAGNVNPNENTRTPSTPQDNGNSAYVPFHRRLPQRGVDGDDHPDMFSVPQHMRNIYPPTSPVGEFRCWWSIISGYETGVFCDNW